MKADPETKNNGTAKLVSSTIAKAVEIRDPILEAFLSL